MSAAARINRLLETSLYVADVDRSMRFYREVLGFEPVEGGILEMLAKPADLRFCPLQIPGGQLLLLFQKGSSATTTVLPGGTIPPHDGDGRLHLAFAVDELESWRKRLQSQGVAVEGETAWPRGGRSVYFRDPDGHLVELATPGLWSIY